MNNIKRAIVLAAGKGTRMKSELPKVLFPVCGKPMLEYVLDALQQAGVEEIFVVVGYCGNLVRQTIANRFPVTFVEQEQQLGTGHAVMACREELRGKTGPLFIIAGDSPLLRADSVNALFERYEAEQVDQVSSEQDSTVGLLGTSQKENPFGMGRILRNKTGKFVGIVEEKDATDEQRTITEVNMSYYLFDIPSLLETLGSLRANNAQNEYYITDVPGILLQEGKRVLALPILRAEESLGVNTLDDLVAVEAAMTAMKERVT